MKTTYLKCLICVFLLPALLIISACSTEEPKNDSSEFSENSSENSSGNTTVSLPDPIRDGNISLENALDRRRSVRDYRQEPLTIEQLSQLLWAAQGITGGSNRKTAPSAGALYPLEVLVSADNVTGLAPGIYRYVPADNKLILIVEGLFNDKLSDAGLGQSAIADAPVCIMITAVFERITGRYGERGINYAYVEAGHVCQNILLQAVALDLGAVPIGAFTDRDISEILRLDKKETPIYIIPVGVPK